MPKPPTNMTLNDSESSDEVIDQYNVYCDSTFAGACSSNEPHLLIQGELNDIVCYLNPSKKQAKILDSRLKRWHLLRQEI
jgi:hypothetical protein